MMAMLIVSAALLPTRWATAQVKLEGIRASKDPTCFVGVDWAGVL